jgi:hypothetical protein
MRYDRLMAALEKLKTQYEMNVRRLLAKAVADDTDVSEQILANRPRRTYAKRKPKPKPNNKRWSAAHRRKFIATMRAKREAAA